MNPVQIKIAVAAGIALLAWLLTDKGKAPAQRVTQELLVGANVLDPSTFGLTDEEIAAQKTNPAVDPKMRELIDRSNALLAADDQEGT